MMRSQTPAIASSTALSTTSHTQWWRPDGPVEPMYMPGRLRTGSRPSRTCMSLAPYEVLPCVKARPSVTVDSGKSGRPAPAGLLPGQDR